MDKFSDRLKKALEIRNISAAELSRKIGVDEGTISNYKKGRYEPKQRRLEQISIALDVSIPWLMGADVPMAEDDIEMGVERQIIDVFNRLSPERQKQALEYLAFLAAQEQAEN